MLSRPKDPSPSLPGAVAVCLGQIVSFLGSGMTSFGLGVWIFQKTGSAVDLGLVTAAATLPGVLVAPVSGILVDRFDRRAMMALSDTGAALGTLLLLAFLFTGELRVGHLYGVVAIHSVFNTLQFPAFSAALATLTPKAHLSRVNGLVEFGYAGVQMIAPALGGALISSLELQGVAAVDLLTFGISLLVLAMVRVPSPPPAHSNDAPGQGPFHSQLAFGWRYIRSRAPLLRLLAFIAVLNLLVPMAMLLTTPLVLSFSDAEGLGWVLSCAAASSVLAGVLMSTWGGPKRKLLGVLAAGPLGATGLILASLRPSLPLIAAGLGLVFFSIPVLNGCSQTIWMRRVPAAIQGRVFATRRMVAQCTSPIAFAVAGPLSEKLFEPLLMASGPLATGPLGSLLGRGPGRGTALLMMCLGLAMVLAFLIAIADPVLKQVEHVPSGTDSAPPKS